MKPPRKRTKPLRCRCCGETDPEKMSRSNDYEDGYATICKKCLAARLRAYRKGELIPNYVGCPGRDKPICDVCGCDDPEMLVKGKTFRFGLAPICRPCKQKQSAAKRAAEPAVPSQCTGCGTKDPKKLIPNPRTKTGLSNICRACKRRKSGQKLKPKKPMACTVCMTADLDKLIKRQGKPIRMCRDCKSSETKIANERKKRLAAGSPY